MSLVRAASLTLAALGLTQGLASGLAAQGAPAATKFTVLVENVSQGEVLKLSNGKTAPFVSAPVLWVVQTGATTPIFTGGKVDAGKGLETLAETGNPGPLSRSLASAPGVVSAGAYDKAVGSQEGGPIGPGQKYQFEITAEPGQALSLAWMFGQSNDLFYANERPIALFNSSGKPVTGDLTSQITLWDAGTEVNEEPGLGPNQGPRQADPTAGTPERQGIARVRDKFSYPKTTEVLKLTVAAEVESMSAK